MAKDLVKEAYAQVDAMRDAATETAKNILIEAMSTDLKAAVAQAMSDTLGEDTVEESAVVEAEETNEEASIEESSAEEAVEEAIEEISEMADEDDEDEDEDEVEEDMDMDMDDEDEDDEDDDDDEEAEEAYMKEDEETSDEDEVIEVVEAEEMTEGDELSQLKAQNEKLREANKKYEEALVGVKKQMDEINLFNARLAAATDLMRSVPLTKDQKERVVEHFDNVKTIGEVKRTHKILLESYKVEEKTVRKARINRPNVQSVVTENTDTQENTAYDRLAKLAGTL